MTEERFDRVRSMIQSRRSRTPGRAAPKFDWALRGVLKCAQCGRAMIPSISGYKNIRYRYYRCHSTAGGRAPCRGVGISAYQIEEFVRTSLSHDQWDIADVVVRSQAQAFAAAWRTLDEREQTKTLPDVLQEVVFDPTEGTISLTLVTGAVEIISSRTS